MKSVISFLFISQHLLCFCTSQALRYTTSTVNNVTFQTGDIGQVHNYIALNGNNNGVLYFDNPDNSSASLTVAGFEAVMHEVGHALGLKHPHDYGENVHPNPVVFPGVTLGDDKDLGDNSLNQKLYTIMSYNSPQNLGGGNCSTPMAFDIAAIQYMYGARTGVNAGDNDYYLPDPNYATTWSCIWDIGGTDQIIYLGNSDAVIDLRPATLDNSPTGGGMPSYTKSGANFGHGFTIAGDFTNVIPDQTAITGVIIENARGGGGNDRLTGNNANNTLYGGAGNDTLIGSYGSDMIYGGAGADSLDGGSGNDTLSYGGSATEVNVNLANFTASGGDATGDFFANFENLMGSGHNDSLSGNSENNTIYGMEGNDTIDGGNGNDIIYFGDGNDSLNITSLGDDIFYAGSGDDYIWGYTGNETYYGADGNDILIGFYGNDTIQGGPGKDFLTGGNGTDKFAFSGAQGDPTMQRPGVVSGTRGEPIKFSTSVILMP